VQIGPTCHLRTISSARFTSPGQAFTPDPQHS
jgi:hypothetical protein